MKAIKIGGRRIGGNFPCYVVAEIGNNHNGSISLAKKMILAAKRAGADAVKFQAYKTGEFISKRLQPDAFKKFKKTEFSEKQFSLLKKFSDKNKIGFFASVFDFESADAMERTGVPCFKIASGDLTNLPLIAYAAKKRKPIILSAGMATAGEIKKAIEAVHSAGNKKIILLHCNATYPAKINELNLKRILTLGEKFNAVVGLSDHSTDAIVPAIAVAGGAKMVERHFTIDKKLPGPDNGMSATEKELKKIIENIRTAAAALGSSRIFQVEPKKEITLSRRGAFAAISIAKGEKISFSNMQLKRPCAGIKADEIKKAVGRRAKRNIAKGKPITWNEIGGEK